MALKFYSSIIATTGEPPFVDRGDVTLWECINNSWAPNTIVLNCYKGNSTGKKLYIPWCNGKTLLNTFGALSPYYKNSMMGTGVVEVDMQNVPGKSNELDRTFINCKSLQYVYHINSSTNQMSHVFANCAVYNQNLKLPSKLKTLSNTFYNCTNFNQNIFIPSSVTSMTYTFYSCTNFNQNIQIPASVTSMADAFYGCSSLNQSIQIPKSVTNMGYSFASCSALSGRINVLATNLSNTLNTFSGTSKAKQVYIYYKYANGTFTKTYNAAVLGNNGSSTNVNYKWDGRFGVTVYNLGLAPW